ncbi:UNVERIFIED_CONTAM: hypothetical protein PYX00_004158 [Menopon gallinae]|uniref:THUMP domain-containing protein n=1 Tax=Menopon gallinae TaxID=328185 RepID=A0AAW2I380_9NEOP
MRDLTGLEKLLNVTQQRFTNLTLEASVVTGFESTAVDECLERFGRNLQVCSTEGRIFFNTQFDKYHDFKNLRSVDHVHVLAGIVKLPLGIDPEKKDEDLEIIKSSINLFDWDKALTVWKEVYQFPGIIYATQEDHDYAVSFEKGSKYAGDCNQNSENEVFETEDPHYEKTELEKALDSVLKVSDDEDEDGCDDPNTCPSLKKVPKFRVTCNRVGNHHTFTSMEAASAFGGHLQDKFNWIVDLTNYDLNIILEILNEDVYASISLTKESQHRRNISFFGFTTLKATICYNMLRLSEPKPGDIVIDPLGGDGSIPIEGSFAYPKSYFISGDIYEKSVIRTRKNINALLEKSVNNYLKIDNLHWDATKLPLKSNSIDIFVSDFPFGKRLGSKQNNKGLYKKVLNELARVVRSSTGKCVILTTDRTSFNIGFQDTRAYWKQAKVLMINVGGLRAACYVLIRTSEEYPSV